MTAKKKTPPDFETAMTEFEALVAKMEAGDLPLESSLKEFERGIQLSRICQKALSEAEQRVKILSSDDDEENFLVGSE